MKASALFGGWLGNDSPEVLWQDDARAFCRLARDGAEGEEARVDTHRVWHRATIAEGQRHVGCEGGFCDNVPDRSEPLILSGVP